MRPRTPRSWFPIRQTSARSATSVQQRFGRGPVADEVAQAPELVGRLGVDGAKHRLERMEIPVNVGDDGHSHGSRTLAKRAGLIALAVVWVVSGFFLWRTSVPRLDIPDLDPRDYFSAAELARADEYRRVSRALLLGSLAVQLVVMAVLVWKARPLADALGGIGRGRIRTGVLVSARRRGRALAGDASARSGLAVVAPPLRALDSERGRLAARPGGRRRRGMPAGRRRRGGHTRPCCLARPFVVARRLRRSSSSQESSTSSPSRS